MYVCAPFDWYLQRGLKKTLDLLALEFQRLVSCHVGARNQTQVLYKKKQCSEPEPALQPTEY